MALKHKLTAAQYDALSDDLKKEYSKVGDDYVLQIEGDSRPTQEDVDNALRARDHEKEERKKAQARVKELEAGAGGATAESERLQTEISTLTERLNARDNALKDAALKTAASAVTAKSKYPGVLEPHVKNRMSVEIDATGNAVVTILDAQGKPSKLTADDLVSEFRAHDDFKGLMLGSQASGSGGGNPGGGNEGKSLKDMSEKERVALAKDDPAAFRALSEQQATQP